MKLTEFATELNRVNSRFQVLAGIRTMAPNLKDSALVTAQQEAEKTFKELCRKWQETCEEPTKTLDGLILRDE